MGERVGCTLGGNTRGLLGTFLLFCGFLNICQNMDPTGHRPLYIDLVEAKIWQYIDLATVLVRTIRAIIYLLN